MILLPEEKELINKIGFDEDISFIAKEASSGILKQLIGYAEDGNRIK